MGLIMNDHYQLVSIIAGAIRSCHAETFGRGGAPDVGTEELNVMAKAIIRDLEAARFRICPATKDHGLADDESAV